MWCRIDKDSFIPEYRGFVERTDGGTTLYLSSECPAIHTIRDLATAEYCSAIEIDPTTRRLSFGRDYLGHVPLLYACDKESLLISDNIGTIKKWLIKRGVHLTLSEESLALLLVMGYVPQGMTLYNEIKTCENATLYHWENGQIRKESLFIPIEIDLQCTVRDLEEQIDREIKQITHSHEHIDVWCSGGLDSSIVAYCCSRLQKQVKLLTLTYSPEIRETFGTGELRFVEEMAQHLTLPIREIELNSMTYKRNYDRFISTFMMPTIDTCIIPKYALAEATGQLGLTGEGGDPLFSGVKNNFMLFVQSRQHGIPLGWLYALAHRRFAPHIEEILTHGKQLKEYVTHYFETQLQYYPGNLIRKLFYMNTFLKQGSLIFPESYYARKNLHTKMRHPLTALSVYTLAFRLQDQLKYRYPQGKLALLDIYRERLPAAITRRKKSGTRLPIHAYLDYLTPPQAGLKHLSETGFIQPNLMTSQLWEHSVYLRYALLTLNNWLAEKGENDDSYIST